MKKGRARGCEILSSTIRTRIGTRVGLASRVFRNDLDRALLLLAGLSFLAALLANRDDSFARDAACQYVGWCWRSKHADAWNEITYDIAIGLLVSWFFYVLVVRVPQERRNTLIRLGLDSAYRAFRMDCTSIILSAVGGGHDAALPEVLLDKKKWVAHFKEKISRDQERWHSFLNNIDDYHFRQLALLFSVFRTEIQFALYIVEVNDIEHLDTLKRLSNALYANASVQLDSGYEELKPFSRFLWAVLGGFDWVVGYRDDDPIQKAIDSI